MKFGTFGEAAAHGEMIVNVTAGAVSLEALEQAGEENLNGKVLSVVPLRPPPFGRGT